MVLTLNQAFNICDKEAAGTIPVDRLGVALRCVGMCLTDDSINVIKEKAQAGGDTVTFDEFKNYAIDAQSMEVTDQDVEWAFKQFGKDSTLAAPTRRRSNTQTSTNNDDGDDSMEENRINVNALKHALTTLGDKLTQDEVDTFFLKAGIPLGSFASTIDIDTFISTVHDSLDGAEAGASSNANSNGNNGHDNSDGNAIGNDDSNSNGGSEGK